MITFKSGFAVLVTTAAIAGCTPAQYEVAYNQVVEPFSPATSTSRAQSTATAPAKTRKPTPTVMASGNAQSAAPQETVDFSQSSTTSDAVQREEKLFSEERDDNGGGSGGGSGSSWGG